GRRFATQGQRASAWPESPCWTLCSWHQVGYGSWAASRRKERNCPTGNSSESFSRFSVKKEVLRMPLPQTQTFPETFPFLVEAKAHSADSGVTDNYLDL